jgi:deoxyribonuclease V
VILPGLLRWGAVDVHYSAMGGAWAALVVTADRRFTYVVEERVYWSADAAPYQPGSFFLRELPAIEAVLASAEALDLVVVDGYVDLDPSARPGLGAHLYKRIQIPVIGVAKKAFRTATHAAVVHRGGSQRPLYVTAAGLAVDEAATIVTEMAGAYRMPDALRRVDALARGGGAHVGMLPR